jgi:phosphoglycolate phosphatase-like HAD superfamily hydrolase
VFDLDGTLVDSDRSLVEPFLRLGVHESEIRLGPLLVDECERLGVAVADYLALYDPSGVEPYPGIDDVVRSLDRWAVCSNKLRDDGLAQLARFGWEPSCALFAEDFGGAPKSLGPVLARLEVDADDVVFVGDTAHDRSCAHEVGATFLLAGWNPRARGSAQPDDLVLAEPSEVLRFASA